MKCQALVIMLAGILGGGPALSAADVQPVVREASRSTAWERAVSAVREQFRAESDSLMAGDIRSFITIRTNLAQGELITLEDFTRHGQTNLARITVTKDGVLQHRGHNFYHQGILVGRYISGGGHTIINSMAGTPYSFTFTLVLDGSNQPAAATIQSTKSLVDLFLCTNGVFYPELMPPPRESNERARKVPGR